MKNMKKLISALTALSFVTVAGVSVVACGQNDTTSTKARMNSKVLNALGLVDQDGASLVTASIKDNQWNVTALTDIKASDLLTTDGKAKNDESKNFLKSVLKLTEKDGQFNTVDAVAIKLVVTEVKPVLKKITNDFAIEKGTVTVKWQGTVSNVLGTYTINLKVDTSKGVIDANLPELALAYFNTKETILSEFKVGGKTEQLKSGELQSFLLKDNATVKELLALNKLVNQGDLKITIRAISTEKDTFAAGDTLTLNINFGDLQFKTTSTLTVLDILEDN